MTLKKYLSMTLVAATLVSLSSSCDSEKDLVIIEGQLPIKTSTLYMVGDATPNGWSIDVPTPLTPTAEDPLVFTWVGNLNVGEMKLCLITGSWDAPFIRPMHAGDAIGKNGVPETEFKMHAGDPDDKWNITDAGVYNLRFDLRNWKMSAQYVKPQEEPVVTVEPIEAENVYIVGDATPNGWNIDAPTRLDKRSDYVFVYEGPLSPGEMKACVETGSWDVNFIRPQSGGCKINKSGVESNTFVFTANPDNKWNVTESAIYRITFNLKEWTITTEYTGDYVSVPKLFMIGTATSGGWSLDNATEFTPVDGVDGEYTWTGFLNIGTFKACTEKDFSAPFYRPSSADVEVSINGVSAPDMVYTTDPDDQWNVTTAGNYKLTLNLNNLTIKAQYLD